MVADAGFSSRDRHQYDLAVRAGRDMSAPVRVTHFFSLPSPGARPIETEGALADLGISRIITDEELTGDGYWHVAAFTTLLLTSATIRQAEQQMSQLAVATGIGYDGWEVTLTLGERRDLASHERA